MNYKVIADENILKAFILNFLPRLEQNECFYVCLFARSKYAKNSDGANKFPHIKTDKAQLKRLTVQNKMDLLDKLKQMECAIGSYKTKDGEDIPQESLACYISLNPRNHKKGLFHLSKRLIDILQSDGNGFNLHQEALSAIQQSKSRTIYNVFDIDSKKEEDINQVKALVNADACHWLETRGGYHLLISPLKVATQYRNNYYNSISKLPFVDNDAGNDIMIPIPGTYQGGFIPHFV